METIECILKRRSVRRFKHDTISDKIINTLLECAMAGPSAVNKKPWEFYVIKNSEVLERIRKASLYSDFNAPLAIIVAGNTSRSLSKRDNDFWIQDCSASIENILLAATSLGLGSVWCGIYPIERVVTRIRKELNASENIIPLGLVYIGYPDQDLEARTQFDENNVHII